jgi:hypothetical protein
VGIVVGIVVGRKFEQNSNGAVFQSAVLVVSYLPARFEMLCTASFFLGGLLCTLVFGGGCAFTGRLDLFGIATELTGSSCPLQQHCKDLPSYLLMRGADRQTDRQTDRTDRQTARQNRQNRQNRQLL